MMAMLEVAINIITGLIVIMFVIKTMSPINCAIINYTSSCELVLFALRSGC